jgi:hypothetical protein
MESVLTDGKKMHVSQQERWFRRRRRSDVSDAVSRRASPQQQDKQGKDQGHFFPSQLTLNVLLETKNDMQSPVSCTFSSANTSPKINVAQSPTAP